MSATTRCPHGEGSSQLPINEERTTESYLWQSLVETIKLTQFIGCHVCTHVYHPNDICWEFGCPCDCTGEEETT